MSPVHSTRHHQQDAQTDELGGIPLRALAILILLPACLAGSTSAVLGISATVIATCSVSTTPLLATRPAMASDNTATVSVSCNAGFNNFIVALDSKAATSASQPMDGDAARRQTQGNLAGTDKPSAAATGMTERSYTLYAQKPAQPASAGAAQAGFTRVYINY